MNKNIRLVSLVVGIIIIAYGIHILEIAETKGNTYSFVAFVLGFIALAISFLKRKN